MSEEDDKRRKSTIQTTTAVSMSTAGLAGLLGWIFQMLQAGMLMSPSEETLMLMAGFALPIIQAVRENLLYKLERRK